MKKVMSLGMAAVMALSAGSAFAVQAEEADYSECTIKFAWWGGDSRHEATQKAVNAFMEKYPGINVEVNFGAWSDWESARALEFQSGTAADVNQINLSWINEFDSDGSVFLDLNEVSDIIDLSQWEQVNLDMMKDPNGGLAGVPAAMTGRIFYWDKTTF
ncbi:MAG TPA: ABC transporter substrate-binding protein, partial [Lachnospiraceae bacterium]|nr:ABC transporter substrate-binding protein [Lachnospiraceae bacterium]